jgi:RNA polymerase sigma-70 factor (ECF subfamily)
MFSIAYRMLGSVAEAEDIVQEAFLRMHRSTQQTEAEIDNLDAYATTVTTRIAIDTLRSARHRREQYVGPWLPEPILVSDEDPSHRLELDETVSTAFLVLLESLTPVERAVFVLREVLGYDYDDIAPVVDKSATNCRQIFTRARKRIADGTPRFEPSRERRDQLASQFVADGGGRAPAIQRPMLGAVAVARFLLGLMRQGERFGVRLELSHANGQPAMLTRGADGALLGVIALDVDGGRIVRMHNVLNPDKLGHLGEVGDLFALLAER